MESWWNIDQRRSITTQLIFDYVIMDANAPIKILHNWQNHFWQWVVWHSTFKFLNALFWWFQIVIWMRSLSCINYVAQENVSLKPLPDFRWCCSFWKSYESAILTEMYATFEHQKGFMTYNTHNISTIGGNFG